MRSVYPLPARLKYFPTGLVSCRCRRSWGCITNLPQRTRSLDTIGLRECPNADSGTRGDDHRRLFGDDSTIGRFSDTSPNVLTNTVQREMHKDRSSLGRHVRIFPSTDRDLRTRGPGKKRWFRPEQDDLSPLVRHRLPIDELRDSSPHVRRVRVASFPSRVHAR